VHGRHENRGDPVPEIVDSARATVSVVQRYLGDLERGDTQSAATRFSGDLTYVAAGRNRLAGITHGRDAARRWFAAMGELSAGTYAISAMHWLTSPDRVGLLTRNHATRSDRSLSWDELIVFTFVDGRKKRIDHFSGDQYGVDDLFA
jgi:ketosteroid isomerase-like protein